MNKDDPTGFLKPGQSLSVEGDSHTLHHVFTMSQEEFDVVIESYKKRILDFVLPQGESATLTSVDAVLGNVFEARVFILEYCQDIPELMKLVRPELKIVK